MTECSECLNPSSGDRTYICPIHGWKMTPHFCQLFITKSKYKKHWLEVGGPDHLNVKDTTEPQKNKCQPLTLHKQAWNLAEALAAFVADGMKFVTEEQYACRLEICNVCDKRRGNRCIGCGCRISLKARGRAFTCPIGKWELNV